MKECITLSSRCSKSKDVSSICASAAVTPQVLSDLVGADLFLIQLIAFLDLHRCNFSAVGALMLFWLSSLAEPILVI